MKKIGISQSNYIPWKGYFDLIASVDEFILYDDMQYTRRDWRNRNKIRTADGLLWLTVPVKVKGQYHQSIRETEIADPSWARKHWGSLTANYRRAEHFDMIADWLAPLYLDRPYSLLSDLNRTLIASVCEVLGITTRISNSWDYAWSGDRSARLASICETLGGDAYVSGPAAREYLDESVFQERGIVVEWANYDGYPEYPQLWPGFEHGVSVLDLLFNCGPDAGQFMKHVIR